MGKGIAVLRDDLSMLPQIGTLASAGLHLATRLDAWWRRAATKQSPRGAVM
jgi:hypothetical protein